MTNTVKKFVRLVYFAAVTAALLAVAVLLMVACVTIYQSGEKPFTPASVAAQFDLIDLPLYVCLGLVAIGFILHPLLPAAPDKDVDRDIMTVRRLRRTTKLEACPAEVAGAIRLEQSRQRLHRWIAVLLTGVGSVGFLIFLLTQSKATIGDPTDFVKQCALLLLLCIAAGAGYGLFSLYYNRKSYAREIALYRKAPAEAKCKAPAQATLYWELPVKRALLVVSVVLIVVGYLMNGDGKVLEKAIQICMECVGLG